MNHKQFMMTCTCVRAGGRGRGAESERLGGTLGEWIRCRVIEKQVTDEVIQKSLEAGAST